MTTAFEHRRKMFKKQSLVDKIYQAVDKGLTEEDIKEFEKQAKEFKIDVNKIVTDYRESKQHVKRTSTTIGIPRGGQEGVSN